MASDAASNTVGDSQLLARAEDAPQPETTSPKTPRHGSRKDIEQKDVLGDEDNKEDNESGEELEEGEAEEAKEADGEEPSNSAPPLPQEDLPPPLPNEAPPGQTEDDGWDPVWDDNAQAYYFYNRFTGLSQWENPRVPETHQQTQQADASQSSEQQQPIKPRVASGYDPAIHGDYDPTAPYAQVTQQQEGLDAATAYSSDPNYIYTATGTFNRFTGKWQPSSLGPESFDDEHKSKKQLNAYFDVDAAANSHDGKSLKAERSGKKLTKKELKAFKEKRRERKEEKRRAWLRD
ncbi:succinate dehydrogenase (ubiquinone) flavoprotein subunit [Blastomyces parvus]|uniref:Succinate dehydrogenase (Ubiquinone) flavoprotein subunit n=1 Tax=Blastomyces parvus TaxID=2060905 RepID=A0A2B7X6P0_9EURO|nr:succinate dehydrogenase (ubiquinone) flavoprotein subunit [Blastomyces parvus]